MNYKFEVKMTVKEMYEFLLYHNYRSFSGIIGIFMGIFILMLFLVNGGNMDETQRIMYLIFAVLILLFPPISLYSKAKMQVKSGAAFKEPITYTINDAGIITEQGEAKAEVEWKQVQKVRMSGSSILLYMNRVSVVILPKASMGADKDAIIAFIKEHTKK